MTDQEAISALVGDLQWQIDQMRTRRIKNNAGHPYNPSHYKRGLEDAIDRGGDAVVEYVRAYLYKPPSGGYQKLETEGALDLACESLVVAEDKPYASLFTDEDREAARERLGPHTAAIAARAAERRARIDAARAKLRETGMPERPDLDWALSSRRN
jgi:hypothetical protein